MLAVGRLLLASCRASLPRLRSGLLLPTQPACLPVRGLDHSPATFSGHQCAPCHWQQQAAAGQGGHLPGLHTATPLRVQAQALTSCSSSSVCSAYTSKTSRSSVARVCMQGVTGCAGWTLPSVSTLAMAGLQSAGVGAPSPSTSRRGSPRSSSWCRAWKRRGAPGLRPG